MVNIKALYFSFLHIIMNMLSLQVTLITLTTESSPPAAIPNLSFFFPASIGAESVVFQVAIQKLKDQDI